MKVRGSELRSGPEIRSGFVLQLDPVNGDTAVFRVPVDTLHTVVTDLFRVKIAAVTLAAADAFPVIQNA